MLQMGAVGIKIDRRRKSWLGISHCKLPRTEVKGYEVRRRKKHSEHESLGK
jgi:hypothetical protein